jgi:predicted dienelactone hydrolase
MGRMRIAASCLGVSCALVLLLLNADASGGPSSRGQTAAQVQASPHAYGLADGPHAVAQIETLIVHDALRGKDLPLRAYFPIDGGPYPVIVFSHGAGGSRDVAPVLLAHWASHGYAVLAPSHADSVALLRENGADAQMGDILRSFGRDPEVRVNRVADLTLILDQLDALPALEPRLAGKIDASRIGVGGHSAGAMTASLIGGATVDMGVNGPGGPEVRSFRDERVDALLLLSGQGITGPGAGFHRASWDAMTLPTLVMTGSHDNSPRTRQTASSRRQPYDYAPPGDKYLLFIEGALHMSFTGRAAELEPGLSARWMERYLGTPDLSQALEYDHRAIFDYVIGASTAFWDATLKQDADAQAWLEGDGPKKWGAGQVEYGQK